MSDFPEGYADDVTKSRRLAILRVLKENEGAANLSVLRATLRALGFRGRFITDNALDDDATLLANARLVRRTVYPGQERSVQTLEITPSGMAFLRREHEPVRGVEYPSLG